MLTEGSAHSRVSLSLQQKQDVIAKVDGGTNRSAIIREYGCSRLAFL